MTAQLLFSSHSVGAISAQNRIVMAPMTRARSSQPGDIPNAMMAEYYAQRASAGMIVTEATQISRQGQGYSFTPGIYSEEQIEGWRKVTEAVHAKGGKIVLQIWHVGRMSHESFHDDGKPVAPSALAPNAQVWVVNPQTGEGEMLDCPVPRALTLQEIDAIIGDFRQAARNAMDAGFDGVEIHGANGYLIDQFLRRTANIRKDAYGGSIENRLRFLREVVDAVADVAGPSRTGIRLAPYITQRGMNDDQIIETILQAAQYLDRAKLAYLHLVEADWDDAPIVPESFRHDLRAAYSGTIIVAGNYDQSKAERIVADGLADMAAFGRPFIANPDLPRRFHDGLPLSAFDGSTLFGGDAHGYTDYGEA